MEEILIEISSNRLTRSFMITKISSCLRILVPSKAIMSLLRFKYNKILMDSPLIKPLQSIKIIISSTKEELAIHLSMNHQVYAMLNNSLL